MNMSLENIKNKKNINLLQEDFFEDQSKVTKRGRPKMEARKKTKKVLFYLYEEEYNKLKELSEAEGMSNFIRTVLREKFDKTYNKM